METKLTELKIYRRPYKGARAKMVRVSPTGKKYVIYAGDYGRDSYGQWGADFNIMGENSEDLAKLHFNKWKL